MRDEWTIISQHTTNSIPDLIKKIFAFFLIFLFFTSSIPIGQSRTNFELKYSYIIEFTSPSLLSKITDSLSDCNKTTMVKSSFLEKLNKNMLNHQSAIEKIRKELNNDISISSICHFHYLFNGIKISNITQSNANKIAALPFIKRIEKDSMLSMQNTIHSKINDSTQSIIIKQDKSDQFNLTSFSGNNISIAFFDTGIDYHHPALSNQYKGGYDFVNQDKDPFDDNGHGTHVIGITAAKSMKITNGMSYSGIAPNASVFAYKVLDGQGYGYTSNFLSAFELAMDPNQDGNISDHIDIISISAGDPEGTENDVLSTAAAQAVNAGICVVAAAGNNGPEEHTVHSPANNPSVIAVGASINNKMIAAYSSRGSSQYITIKPDVVAPGHEILSTWPDNQSNSLSGTSMATPYVSGLIARMLEKNNELSPFEIKSILQSQTTSLGYSIFEEGYGMVKPPDSFLMKDFLPIEVSAIQAFNSNALTLYVNSSITLSGINYSIFLTPIHSVQSRIYEKNGIISQISNEIIILDLKSISSGLYVLNTRLFNNQSLTHIKQLIFFDLIEEESTFPSTVFAGESFSTTFDTKAVHLFIIPFKSIQIEIGSFIIFKAPEFQFTEKEIINATIISIPCTFPIRIEKQSIQIINSKSG